MATLIQSTFELVPLRRVKQRDLSRLGLCVALFVIVALAPSFAEANLKAASDAISAWQLPEAGALLDAAEADGEPSEYLFQRGREAFYLGKYKMAVDYLDQALATGTHTSRAHRITQLRDQVETTRTVTAGYKEFTSPGGYFIIRLEPGKDEVLIPYAFETLDRAYEEIGEDLGHFPPAPVLVEIYPKPATLAAVSGLTEDEIKTSGTIALCSYNRLMLTSPKALVRGYTWRDTLSHEFVHLVITQRTRNTVPIWMHEGIAKFEERRWRGKDDRGLAPTSENVLAKALKKNELVTFEQMHPSMAKLPSQEATSLAFAEVYTVMEFIHRTKGTAGLANLLTIMREAEDAKKGVEELMGIPFAQFERDWKVYLSNRPSQTFDEKGVYVERLQFQGDKKESELLAIGQKEARDFVHLGELLQTRKRFGAAIIEYKKAHRLIGDRNPLLQTRLGRCLIEQQRYDEAAEALARSLKFYPFHHSTHALLGESLFKAGRLDEAEVHLVEAVGINPFDPTPHSLLATIYQDTNRKDLAARAREAARKVD